jgi:hypothetical protein
MDANLQQSISRNASTAVETPQSEKLFRTPVDALIFAFNYSMQQQGRPLADRMASPGGRTGKGLSGNDGAAQAGMIWYELQQMSEIEVAVLVARFAPRSMPCTCTNACCRGYTPNPAWNDAVRTLEQYAQTLLAGHLSNYRLRRRLVEKAIGLKIEIKALAKECGVTEKTAGVHWRTIKEWMNGKPAQHPVSRTDRERSEYADVGNAAESIPAVDGLISTARKNADKLLSTLDFIGEA